MDAVMHKVTFLPLNYLKLDRTTKKANLPSNGQTLYYRTAFASCFAFTYRIYFENKRKQKTRLETKGSD